MESANALKINQQTAILPLNSQILSHEQQYILQPSSNHGLQHNPVTVQHLCNTVTVKLHIFTRLKQILGKFSEWIRFSFTKVALFVHEKVLHLVAVTVSQYNV